MISGCGNIFGGLTEKLGVLANANISPEAMMMQVQMILAQDFSNQLQSVVKQINLAGKVKEAFRGNLDKINKVLAQKLDSHRDDGQQVVDLSAQQAAGLCSAFVDYDYNLDSGSFDSATASKPMEFSSGGKDIKASEMQDFFDGCAADAAKGDYAAVIEKAKADKSDAKNNIYFYGTNNNKFEDETPKFCFMVDGLNAVVEQINNRIADVDADLEQLRTSLEGLMNQRQAAMEGARQMADKLDEVKTNTMNKMGG